MKAPANHSLIAAFALFVSTTAGQSIMPNESRSGEFGEMSWNLRIHHGLRDSAGPAAKRTFANHLPSSPQDLPELLRQFATSPGSSYFDMQEHLIIAQFHPVEQGTQKSGVA